MILAFNSMSETLPHSPTNPPPIHYSNSLPIESTSTLANFILIERNTQRFPMDYIGQKGKEKMLHFFQKYSKNKNKKT